MYHWLYDHFGWPGLFGVSLLFGFALWAGAVHPSYHYYFVRYRDLSRIGRRTAIRTDFPRSFSRRSLQMSRRQR